MEALEVGRTVRACNAGPDQITGERYPYRQLEHENTIRLLFITPGSGEEISSTYSLLHAELGNIPYQALSYEWGLPSDDDPNITIDGHTVRIRKNLSEALKQISSVIRYLDFLLLWIDALCINQSDDGEKSQQVQKMGKIFSSAEQVLAWTGPMGNDSDYAMDILNSAPRDCIFDPDLFENYRARTAILAWCNRPYWKRIWIIQELFLAKRLVYMCGSRSISEHGNALDNCLWVILKSSSQSPSGLVPDNLEYWTKVLRNRQVVKRSLLDWLYVCATSHIMATDARDYIYAVLSISHETRSCLAQMIPDYTKSAETVFEDLNTLMMDEKAREGCESCICKVERIDHIENKIVNGWLKQTVGLNVKIGWHDRSAYPSCNSCGRPKRTYSKGELWLSRYWGERVGVGGGGGARARNQRVGGATYTERPEQQ
ncbi:HET-domain-containing protein [Neurospora hispaniola]|uniref:HET-domain-containing protein n=1 Tax=Neurospora hispaniola TaxID=588809 RepID=A0AAJ0I537_9PEZI|nr:HET-domain-containing protein [Neurospora hispaniola]